MDALWLSELARLAGRLRLVAGAALVGRAPVDCWQSGRAETTLRRNLLGKSDDRVTSVLWGLSSRSSEVSSNCDFVAQASRSALAQPEVQ